MEILLPAAAGLVVGSFLNAVAYRLSVKRSFLFGRSECPACRHALAAWDLVPVFSFIFLRGRCRYCGRKISWQYPIVELITAITFGLLFWNPGIGIWNLVIQAIFASLLILIGVYDFKHFLILDKVVYPAAVLAAVWAIAQGSLLDSLGGALAVAGFFGLQYLASRGKWIGFGDVKLGVFLGILFGFKLGVAVLFLAYLPGGLIGVLLLATGRKNLGSKVPFGSILAASGIMVMVWGERLVRWYLNLIGM